MYGHSIETVRTKTYQFCFPLLSILPQFPYHYPFPLPPPLASILFLHIHYTLKRTVSFTGIFRIFFRGLSQSTTRPAWRSCHRSRNI
jgi:hypothetical protein